MKRLSTLWWLMLAVLSSAAAADIRVGIVADRFDEAFSRDRAELVTEVTQLAASPSRVRFPEAKQLEGGGDIVQSRRALARLQNDKGVDMIVVLGTLAGQVALAEGAAPKPTVIPFLEDAGLLGVDPEGGGSGIRNINYVAGGTAFGTALERYRTVVPFGNAAMLVDARSLALFPEMAGRAAKAAASQGVALDVLPVGRDGAVQVAESSRAVLQIGRAHV